LLDGNLGNGGGKITLSGNLNVGTTYLKMYSQYAAAWTFDASTYNVTCNSLNTGSSSSGAATFNFGSGTWTVSGVYSSTGATYNTGAVADNFQTSQWVCSSNWTFGSNHTVDGGTTATITITTSAPHTIVAAGKTFPIMIMQANTTWSSSGTYTIKELQISAGVILTFLSSITVNLTQFTAGTWTGTSGAGVIKIRASTSGTQFTMSMPASPPSASYMDFKDCNFTTNNITADANCYGRVANNSGITWTGQTTATWISDSTKNWDDTSAWSTGAAPLTTDDVVFNGTHTGTVTVNVDVSVNSISISGYNTNWTFGTHTITVVQGFYSNGTGTGNLGAGLTVTGVNATYWVRSTIGTLTATSCVVTWNEAVGTALDDKGATYKSITVAASKDLIWSGTGSIIFSDTTTFVTVGNSSTLTINQTTSFRATGTCTLFSFPLSPNTYTFNGSGAITIDGTTTALTLTIPAMNWTGTGGWTVNQTGATKADVTFSGATAFGGNLTATSAKTLLFSNTLTFNGASSTFTISAGVTSTGNTSCDLTFNGTTGCTLTDNNGSATFRSLVLGANAKLTNSSNNTTTFISSTTNITLGSGATFTNNKEISIYLTGSTNVISLPASYTINGTGAFDFIFSVASGTATIPAIVISGTNDFYFINDNYVSTSYSMSGAISTGGTVYIYNRYVTITSTFNTNGYAITCGKFEIGTNNASGTETINLSSSVINCTSFNSSTRNAGTTNLNMSTSQWTDSGNFSFGSNTTVSYSAGQLITITGTSTITSATKSFLNVTINAGANTVTAVDAMTIADGGTFTVSTAFNFTPTASITLITFAGSYTWNGVGAIGLTGSTASLTLSLPATTYTGSGTWTIAPAASSTFKLTGNYSSTGNLVHSTGIFNQNSYTMTVGTVTINSSAANVFNANWSVSGSWTWGASSACTNTSNVTFTGTGTITSNSKPFYNVIVNSSGIITLSGHLYCNNFLNTAGTLSYSGNNIYANPYVNCFMGIST